MTNDVINNRFLGLGSISMEVYIHDIITTNKGLTLNIFIVKQIQTMDQTQVINLQVFSIRCKSLIRQYITKTEHYFIHNYLRKMT